MRSFWKKHPFSNFKTYIMITQNLKKSGKNRWYYFKISYGSYHNNYYNYFCSCCNRNWPSRESILVTKLVFTGCLEFSLMFGIKMLSQRIGKGFLLEILGAVSLVYFYFYFTGIWKVKQSKYFRILRWSFYHTYLFPFSVYFNLILAI